MWPFTKKESIITRDLYPYKITEAQAQVFGYSLEGREEIWVFDDESVGLKWEAFISGTDEAIDYLVKDIPNARNGFKMTFSHQPFNGHQLVGDWMREGYNDNGFIPGNWYVWHKPGHWTPGINGWLCPALFLYFEEVPKKLYIRAESMYNKN